MNRKVRRGMPDKEQLIVRLRVLLNDPEALIWSDAILEECLRLALTRIQTVCPYDLTISGLDGGSETNLDQEIKLTPLLLQLASRQALKLRQGQRSELFHPDPQKSTNAALGIVPEEGVLHALDEVRRYFLQRSQSRPF